MEKDTAFDTFRQSSIGEIELNEFLRCIRFTLLAYAQENGYDLAKLVLRLLFDESIDEEEMYDTVLQTS